MRFVEVIAQVPLVASAHIEEGGTEVPEIGLFLSHDFLTVGGYVEVSHIGTGILGGDYVEDVFRRRPIASFFGSVLSRCLGLKCNLAKILYPLLQGVFLDSGFFIFSSR